MPLDDTSDLCGNPVWLVTALAASGDLLLVPPPPPYRISSWTRTCLNKYFNLTFNFVSKLGLCIIYKCLFYVRFYGIYIAMSICGIYDKSV
jgi:hypothetical protein